MHVIGTAGHVDHGKSTLVRAITGIDPDRLKEEQARQMTIDLGFAWLTLGGEQVGIIDVPGHRDFIENMLAGVGGIEAVLFVIAADEGVMPQTREHLAIIDLLGIPTGVIALTKIDVVQDSDWLELVQYDLADKTSGTILADAPVVPVSARTGENLDKLLAALSNQIATLPTAKDIGRPRLWIDRVFSISGFGTVVTGTLQDGQLEVGQTVEISGMEGRIRGLQSHQQPITTAQPGSRVAVNITGIEKHHLHRGDLLTLPDMITPTLLVDVHFRSVRDLSHPLKHQSEVKFFCGSAETTAKVRLLDSDGEWLQLQLNKPLPLVRGDRFILRYPSPGETIGGGQIIDAAPGQRWKRNRPEVITRLEIFSRSNSRELILYSLETARVPLTSNQIMDITGLEGEIVSRELTSIAGSSETILALDHDWWIAQSVLDRVTERLVESLASYHKAEPLKPGMRPEAMVHALKMEKPQAEIVIGVALRENLIIRTEDGLLALPDHSIGFSKAQQESVDSLLGLFADSPYAPPSAKDAAVMVGDEVLAALIERGDLIQVSGDVLFAPATFEEIVTEVRRQLEESGQTTIKELRDRFETSRKYAQAILEYLDEIGITRREGDNHVIGSGDWIQVQQES